MKKGSYKYLLQLLHAIRREIRELRRTQRYMIQGLEHTFLFDDDYIKTIACKDEVDEAILDELYMAGPPGKLPRNVAAEKTESFHLHVLTEKADPDAKIFPWSMPARYYMKPGRTVIYGSAVVAVQTRKGDIYTRDEVIRGAREPICVVLFPFLNGFALLPIL